METFSKLDIFATKGTEYLFVIGYLLILIIFWKISNKQVKIKEQAMNVINNLSANILRIPQGLFFNKNHTWAFIEKSGNAKVGMDDFFQHVTGEVEFSNLKNPGEIINKGDLLTEINQGDKKLKIFSPISGKIVETNPMLYEDPKIVNADPYEKGWFYNIKPSNWIQDTKSYFIAETATQWATKELERFKDFLSGRPVKDQISEQSLVMLQDGGELRDNILSELPNEVWIDFQKEFLNIAQKKK